MYIKASDNTKSKLKKVLQEHDASKKLVEKFINYCEANSINIFIDSEQIKFPGAPHHITFYKWYVSINEKILDGIFFETCHAPMPHGKKGLTDFSNFFRDVHNTITQQ